MIFILCWLIVCAWMSGVMTVAALKYDKQYWAGVVAGILLSLYLGIALIGYVSEHPL